ncbi:unnamed protein product [Enterobius vermicularis]|uniref:Cytochrome P450 n=1 Tax=Enterobius vermicularis TaxID=51028 RepID=A0A0N4V0Z8_ENTVE|nr:unnamed protein product [Enterobius vermicularis]
MIVIVGVLTVLIICLMLKRHQLLEKYRYIKHIYDNVNKMPGPKTIPLFGNCLAFSANQTILENPNLNEKPSEYKVLNGMWGDGLIASSGKKWHTRRKMLTPAFHPTVIRNYYKSFNKHSQILMEILDKFADKDETFDLLPYLRRYSLDITTGMECFDDIYEVYTVLKVFFTDTTLGFSLNSQKGENMDYYDAVTRTLELAFKSLRYPWLRIKPIATLLGHTRKMEKYAAVTRQLPRKVVLERKKEYDSMKEKPTFEEVSSGKNNRKSFLDLLLSLQKEYNLTVDDICEEVETIFVAGHDNVSSSIGFALFVFGAKPEFQDKVYEELHTVLGDEEREITSDDLKNLVYLEQWMKEIMRLYMPVIMLARRITEDVKIGEYTIPAGVTACISPFSVARDPKEWEDPDQFNPDHFSPENIAKRDPFAFIPFSAGIRNCLGKQFAFSEEKMALAHLLHRYEFHSMISEEENRALPEVTLKPSRGFPMRITRRKKMN